MNNKEVLNYVSEWLEQRRIKSYFNNKKFGKEKYIKINETDLYELCYKLVKLIDNNTEQTQ